MAKYKWRGMVWEFDEKDLDKYPGAVPVSAEPKEKKKAEPANKSRRPAKSK